jgi:hypothetical protein
MRRYALLVMFVFVAAVLLCACGKSDQAPQTEKEAYFKQVEEKLAGFDKKLADLKAKSGQMSGDAKTQLDTLIKAVEERQAVARKGFNDLKGSTGVVFDDLQSYLNTMLRQIEEMFQKAPA